MAVMYLVGRTSSALRSWASVEWFLSPILQPFALQEADIVLWLLQILLPFWIQPHFTGSTPYFPFLQWFIYSFCEPQSCIIVTHHFNLPKWFCSILAFHPPEESGLFTTASLLL